MRKTNRDEQSLTLLTRYNLHLVPQTNQQSVNRARDEQELTLACRYGLNLSNRTTEVTSGRVRADEMTLTLMTKYSL